MNYIMVIFFAAGFGGGGVTVPFSTEAACLQAAQHFTGVKISYRGCVETATGRVVDVK